MIGRRSFLQSVIKRFPEHWARICRLAENDEGFCELCRDYTEAVQALARCQEETDEQAPNRARDYADVVAELEEEITREITESDK